MALTLAHDTHTEIGLVRSNNQDSAFASPRMLMVADGMGGAAAGDLASAVAVWELQRTDADLDALLAAAHDERTARPAESDADATDPQATAVHATAAHAVASDEDPGSLTDVLTVMAGTLARANETLVTLVDDDPELAGMGTTVCGFVLHEDRLAVVNIGDSRAYLIRDGRLHRVTHDHSWVQTLVDEGRISEAEALEHPHRSLVLRVLNGSSAHEPDLGWLDVVEGDRLMVCSDGLCGLVTDAQIEEVVADGRPRQAIIDDLVALAHTAGGYDNITIVLADVEVDGPPPPVVVIGSAATAQLPAGAERTLTFPALTESDPEVAHERAITEEERYALQGRRRGRTRLKVALLFLLPILAVGGGAFGWYQYTQTQYFVGAHVDNVALFRGVPDRVLGLPLSTLLETDTTKVSDLPPYYSAKVHANIRVGSLPAARSTIIELREKAARCVEQREARAKATAAPAPTSPAPVTPATTPASPASTSALTGGPATTPGTDGATPGTAGPTSLTPEPSASVSAAPTAPEDC